MTDLTIPLLECLRKLDLDLDGDVLRGTIRVLTQVVMKMEVEQRIGAADRCRKIREVAK